MRVALLSIAILLIKTCPLAAQGNLLSNGGFEAPVQTPGGYLTIAPGGEPGGFAWSVSAGDVDLGNLPVSPFILYSAFEGNQALDLNGNQRGAIFQDFVTLAGQSYQVSFAYADNPLEGGVSSASILVSDVGLNTTLLSDGVSHSTSTNIVGGADYFLYSRSFTASGSLTRLSIASTSPSNSASGGIVLDAVSVSAVPEPSAMSLFMIGAMGLGLRRRVRV